MYVVYKWKTQKVIIYARRNCLVFLPFEVGLPSSETVVVEKLPDCQCVVFLTVELPSCPSGI